jgi:hypothetical protein
MSSGKRIKKKKKKEENLLPFYGRISILWYKQD